MRVLVTGAGGFLGRRVVQSLSRRGHSVRAIVRPGAAPAHRPDPGTGIEECSVDLDGAADLHAACDGVQAVVHLALQGTERLLDAMRRARVGRVVLASSLSVYDWSRMSDTIDEDSPLEPHPESRDAYTTTKLRQEELVRQSEIALTALRPGVIWGAGREFPPTIGQRLGPAHVVFAPDRQLPSVHVENCADAFAAVLDAGSKADGVFDVIDDPGITARRFVQDHLTRSGRFGFVVPAGYRSTMVLFEMLSRCVPGPVERRLPSFMGPARFRARYRPVRIDGARLRGALGWRPPLSYLECLDATYARR